MNRYIEALNNRFQVVLDSKTDGLFYQNVHAYIDFIVKTPELAAIIEKSESEYSAKHSAIWSSPADTEEELDRREEQTYRLERFSLFAMSYAFLKVRIYDLIEHYKNCTDFDTPHTKAMLMLRGIKSMRVEKADRKRVKLFNRHYDGKRMEYQNRLVQFHADFLTELYREAEQPLREQTIRAATDISDIPFAMNARTGDFTFFNTRGSFSPSSQEFKIMKTLYEDKDHQASYLTLLRSYLPGVEDVTKTKKYGLYIVIRNIKGKMGILPKSEISNPDIFKTKKNYGYQLSLEPEELKAEES